MEGDQRCSRTPFEIEKYFDLLSDLCVFLCDLCVEKVRRKFHAEFAETFAEAGEIASNLTLTGYFFFFSSST